MNLKFTVIDPPDGPPIETISALATFVNNHIRPQVHEHDIIAVRRGLLRRAVFPIEKLELIVGGAATAMPHIHAREEVHLVPEEHAENETLFISRKRLARAFLNVLQDPSSEVQAATRKVLSSGPLQLADFQGLIEEELPAGQGLSRLESVLCGNSQVLGEQTYPFIAMFQERIEGVQAAKLDEIDYLVFRRGTYHCRSVLRQRERKKGGRLREIIKSMLNRA